MKYKAILIEDDPSTRLVIEKSLKEIQAPVELIGTYNELEEALVPLSSQGIDLVFLDIELGGGVSGFDLFKTFPRPYFEVIFVTGHQKHALKAIQYACLDFLVKALRTKTTLYLSGAHYATFTKHCGGSQPVAQDCVAK
jgi:two-component system LytT family response regulator